MKKYILPLLLSISLLTIPVKAQELKNFFKEISGQWNIVGILADKDINPSCVLSSKWPNGAFISLVNDLNDGKLFLIYHNPQFKFIDSVANVGFLSFFGKETPKEGLKLQFLFEVVNDSTIRTRQLTKELILPLYSESTKMEIILPGTLPKVVVGLTGTRQSLFQLNMCINKWRETHPIPKKGELL